MRHRRTSFNAVSADLVEYLVTRHQLTQNDIAEMIEVDKSFVSRVRNGEREFSSKQMGRIADRLDMPMGAMLIALHPDSKPRSAEVQHIVDLCKRLMHQGDAAIAAHRARRAAAG